MFTRIAKFRRLEPRQLVPNWFESAHANDNPRGRRRPAGQRRSPPPALACHWVLAGEGRLECRWRVESFDEMSAEDADGGQIPGKISGLPLIAVRLVQAK